MLLQLLSLELKIMMRIEACLLLLVVNSFFRPKIPAVVEVEHELKVMLTRSKHMILMILNSKLRLELHLDDPIQHFTMVMMP